MLHLFFHVEAELLAVVLVRDRAELGLRDERALVQAVVAHLAEVLGPHVVVVLIPPVVVLRVAELEAVEVEGDGGDAEGHADELLPALGDRAA
jgi:hypothetical protein